MLVFAMSKQITSVCTQSAIIIFIVVCYDVPIKYLFTRAGRSTSHYSTINCSCQIKFVHDVVMHSAHTRLLLGIKDQFDG